MDIDKVRALTDAEIAQELIDARDLEQDPAGLHDRHPMVGRALA